METHNLVERDQITVVITLKDRLEHSVAQIFVDIKPIRETPHVIEGEQTISFPIINRSRYPDTLSSETYNVKIRHPSKEKYFDYAFLALQGVKIYLE